MNQVQLGGSPPEHGARHLRLSSPTPLSSALAKLPPDMSRVIIEFLLGVVPRFVP